SPRLLRLCPPNQEAPSDAYRLEGGCLVHHAPVRLSCIPCRLHRREKCACQLLTHYPPISASLARTGSLCIGDQIPECDPVSIGCYQGLPAWCEIRATIEVHVQFWPLRRQSALLSRKIPDPDAVAC